MDTAIALHFDALLNHLISQRFKKNIRKCNSAFNIKQEAQIQAHKFSKSESLFFKFPKELNWPTLTKHFV